jgi:hypothetical protein
MFRIEDLQAYMMRLFLEYARLVADEGEDMVRSPQRLGTHLMIRISNTIQHYTTLRNETNALRERFVQ